MKVAIVGLFIISNSKLIEYSIEVCCQLLYLLLESGNSIAYLACKAEVLDLVVDEMYETYNLDFIGGKVDALRL